MNRELLPDSFYIKTRNCMDKNRAIVKILLEFGIYVHSEESKEDSLKQYNDCFSAHYNIIVSGNRASGDDSEIGDKIILPNLLKAYGKL